MRYDTIVEVRVMILCCIVASVVLCPFECQHIYKVKDNLSTKPLKVWDAIASKRKQSLVMKVDSC